MTWTGRLSPAAQEIHDEYTRHLKLTGVLPWEDDDAWTALTLPDPETQGEP